MSEQKQPESFKEPTYDGFYERFERDRDSNGEVSKSMYNLGKYARYVTGFAALLFGGHIIIRKASKKQKMGRREFIMEGSLTAAAAGLTVHFHEAKEISGQMYRKNTGEELTQEEIDDVKRNGQIGRAAHYAAATGVGVSITAVATTSRRGFLTSIPFFAIAPFWYYHVVHRGYGALYNSMVDYTTGERRFENYNVPHSSSKTKHTL